MKRSELGRYELKERLAAGGMGVIHRAHDRLAQREVAYKRLVVTSEPSRARLTALFQREFDTLAHLAHPNIVETYDYGQDADGPYYTMELLSGDDLSRLAPLPYREACRILRDVASALALVHARRLIHRDVSPANVRLTAERRAKLIDFGALMPFGTPQELVGTPSCMAPECLTGGPLDQRADLYALGAVMYWALTLKTPVRARRVDELLEAWSEPVLAPSRHVPEIPSELDALVLSLLAHDPLARPAGAAYVIDRLTAIAELPPEADERRVAYSYLAVPPLAGRAEPLQQLEAALVAGDSSGTIALIEAQAGLGRSALIDALALRAQLSGLVVLRGAGDRRAGSFGLARKLIASAAALVDEQDSRASGEWPRVTHRPGQKAPTAQDVAARNVQMVESVRKTLREIAAQGRALIVIDDLHASDPESLALLASLREELRGRNISLLASVLAGGRAEALPGYARLVSDALRIHLPLLTEEQVVELVQALFGGVPNSRRLGQWLHTQSGGNPATCVDLARLLLQRGIVRYTLGTFTLPHTLEADVSTEDLSEAVLARIGSLGAHAHRVAHALCLHEGPLAPDQLARVLEIATRDVLLALEELSSRGVVAHAEGGFALTATSLRDTLQRGIDTTHAAELHVRLARELLAGADEQPDARLHAATHLLHAGREAEAAELVAALGTGLTGESAARWVVLIEAVLRVFASQGRSKEQQLALLIPLMHAGFYGQLEAQRRHIEEALRWMSLVCGMTLARRARPYLGGKPSLALGLLYATARRAFTPRDSRLGTLPQMLAEFVGLVSAGTAAAVSADDTAAALRWNEWLEPLAVLPSDSSGYLLREFCLATVEIGVGELRSASARYARLMPALLKPVAGLDDKLRLTIYRGCLNGRAQAEVQEPHSITLALADELGQGDPFFAPHAECARAGYYGYRGEQDKAEHHRAQAELLALRGGNSWSAETIIARRVATSAIMTRDAIGLVQAIAAVERLRTIAPNLLRYKAFCQAWLEHSRGRPERGVELYEQHIDAEGSRVLFMWRFDRACYAALLNAAGQHARAKAVCKELLDDQPDLTDLRDLRHFALPQLALAEAGLGELELAARLMETHLANARGMNNALLLGDAYRDRAQIALLAGDRARFDEHFEAMTACFRATRNPSLIQQSDALLAAAVRAGLRAPAPVAQAAPLDLGPDATALMEQPQVR